MRQACSEACSHDDLAWMMLARHELIPIRHAVRFPVDGAAARPDTGPRNAPSRAGLRGCARDAFAG